MNAFHKTTWSQVKAGDTVLMYWESLDKIIEVEITRQVTEPAGDGKLIVIATFIAFGEWGRSFDPDETVYVQSRF